MLLMCESRPSAGQKVLVGYPEGCHFEERRASTILCFARGRRARSDDGRTVGYKPTTVTSRQQRLLLNRSPINYLVGLQPTVIASRASPPLLEQSSLIRRIVDARRPSINYHVTLVFRASRALRRPKLNPNPSL